MDARDISLNELISCTLDLDEVDGWIYTPKDGYSTHVAIQRRLENFWCRMLNRNLHFRHLLVHQIDYEALHEYFNTWSDLTILESGEIITTVRRTSNKIQSVICQTIGDAMRLSISPKIKLGMFVVLYTYRVSKTVSYN